jgi:hypothetical protein
MNDKRTVSTIDLALQKHDTPVGPLFVAVRHGRIKKCFTRDTAIRYLAFFMTTEAFERSGFPQRHRGCVLIAMTGRYGETGKQRLSIWPPTSVVFAVCVASWRASEKWRNGVRNGTRCMTVR